MPRQAAGYYFDVRRDFGNRWSVALVQSSTLIVLWSLPFDTREAAEAWLDRDGKSQIVPGRTAPYEDDG